MNKKYPYLNKIIDKIDRNKVIKLLKNYNNTTTNNIINLNYYKNKHINQIADYYTEPCRIECLLYNEKETLLSYFKKNEQFILNTFNNDPYNIRSYLNKNVKSCTNFNIVVGINILEYFKPSIWVDISSGWGDRLAAAICYNILNKDKLKLYYGTDPNIKLKKYYKQIINNLCKPSEIHKYKIIHDGFLETDHTHLYNKCDLVFSSPPFFNIEIYSNNKNDSYTKNDTSDKWINNFLLPVVEKSYTLLNTNGHLVLYIEDREEFSYIEIMINYAIKIGFKKLNSIFYKYSDLNTRRELFVFKKTSD